MISRDQWRVEGIYIDKGPFPQPSTSVQVIEWSRNTDSGEVFLRIKPVHGDQVYYDIGAPATPSSAVVKDFQQFQTSDMEVSFLCVDSTNEHKTGEPVLWQNRVTLQKGIYPDANGKRVELRSAPANAKILYTTDGSNPRTGGGLYDGPFVVKKGTRYVLAVAQKSGIESELLKFEIDWERTPVVKPDMPAQWDREHAYTTTADTFSFVERLKKHKGSAATLRITVGRGENYVDLRAGDAIKLSGEQIEQTIEAMRCICTESDVSLDAEVLFFPTGLHLTDFAAEEKMDIAIDKVKQ